MTRHHHGADRIEEGTLPRASADMNVTPLIDVLLVPDSAATQIVAEYTADGRLMVNKRPIEIGSAETTFRDLFRTRRDKTLYVIGDAEVRYGEIARIIDAATGAGVHRVGIVTESMRKAAR